MDEDFKARYRIAAEHLLGSLPKDCGMTERSLTTAEAQFGIRLPLALRDYYLSIGNLRALNNAHNRLLAPKDWFLNAGKLVFMVENQGVVYWGVTALKSPEDDPPVFQGVNLLPESIEWHPEHDRCSEFLLIMLHWQAVCGGLEWLGMADVGPAVVRHFGSYWHPVGKQEGIVAFRREGQSACIIGEGDAQQLYVGTRSQELFEQICSELGALGVNLNQL